MVDMITIITPSSRQWLACLDSAERTQIGSKYMSQNAK